MLVTKKIITVKRKLRGGLLLLTFTAIICVAFSVTGNNDFDFARREVLLRRIGHEILLQSHDSTSRVLPIKKVAENEYQISFEHAFTFEPGVLVNTTQRLLAKDPLTSDYVVNILNCASGSVAYGYAISKNKKDDIVACIGRRQPTACYIIDIKFKPTGIATVKNGYFLGALLLLAVGGVVVLRPAKPQKASPDLPVITGSPVLPGVPGSTIVPAVAESPDLPASQPAGMFTLGAMIFDPEARKLLLNEMTIDLTKTEARVLHIFALSPNEAIERSRLQKEIWEDEGVIVGRSLDMFISKLRKKFDLDPNVKITVIRGKGYKLEISA